MEFWGAEVKAGEPFKVELEADLMLHLSQASLGESKKGKSNESVVVYVTIDGRKLVLGTLSHDKFPQISYDLIFEKEFELSHNWKNGSVHFCGYTQYQDDSEDGMSGSDFDIEEEEEPLQAIAENGKPGTVDKKAKVSSEKAKASEPNSATKPKSKDAKPISDEDDDSDDEDGDSDDEDMLVALDESSDDDSDESSDEEDEPTPKNDKQTKKRPAESSTKTPVTEKKAKLVTPTKSGGDKKKGNVHTATPHPSNKQGGKTNASADKSKQQTPKSVGQAVCKSCSKTFNSGGALESHTKAKHSGGK